MRLLLVSQDFPPETGGIQSYMGQLAHAISPLCESFSVVAPNSPRLAPGHDASLPFPVHRIGVHSSWLVLPLLAQLPRLVREHRATHVLFAQWFPALAGIRLPSSVRQASMAYGRELLRHPLGSMGLALAGPTLSHLDAVIPCSRRTAELLPSSIRPDRIHVVYPGVDRTRFSRPDEAELERLRARFGILPGAPIVTCLTRLVPRKGVDTLVESAKFLRERLPGTRILVGGKGPDRARIEDKIRQFGVEDTVTLVGRVDDRDLAVFLSLGVFTLLSREEPRDMEGFGMVLAEAQSCGAPVVAARSGGMPEAVGDGAGLIVAPDDPRGAAEAFVDLLTSERHASASLAGQTFVQGLDWPSRAREVVSILEG